MLYDNYKRKILRQAEILRHRFVPVVIVLGVLLLGITAALLTAKGAITGISFKNHMEYGGVPENKVTAFLSSAHFEYTPVGEEEWSREVPKLPGEYDVRVVANGFLGTKIKYVDVLYIYPRRIDVGIEGGTV